MKRILALFLAAVLACSMTACQDQGEPDPTFSPGSNGPSKPISEEEICTDHDLAEAPQTVDDTVTGYCGNTVTTIDLDGKTYSFEGSDSVNLTDVLINLKYDPMKLCRCLPEFTVTTELGGPYGVNLSQGYARCSDGQADLTEEQVELIRKILVNQNESCEKKRRSPNRVASLFCCHGKIFMIYSKKL